MEIKVLDKGFVRLDAHMADDLCVVNSARISFDKHSDSMGDSEIGLINFLMKNRHGTPFESAVFRLHVKTPIFVAREWFRHRIASYNEWSARYSELKDDFYIPDDGNIRSQIGKPGNYKFELLDSEPSRWWFSSSLEDHCRESFEHYQLAIKSGVAKELARMFLPLNIYTEFYTTLNARALMNFLSLRNHESAQFEIREYAKAIENIWATIMPETYKSFLKNNRIAP